MFSEQSEQSQGSSRTAAGEGDSLPRAPKCPERSEQSQALVAGTDRYAGASAVEGCFGESLGTGSVKGRGSGLGWRSLLLIVLLIALAAGARPARPVCAQEGEPTCPPGFFWRRMSGVGCMQEGCLDIANAKYTYTGACSCVEGYRGCYEPVDYAAFDSDACGPHCPTSRLVVCVAPDATCPGEEPSGGGGGGEADGTGEGEPSSADEPSDADLVSFLEDLLAGDDQAPSVSDLVRSLEQFLAGKGVKAPTAGQAAAGAAALSALLSAWVLDNLLSGVSPRDLLRAISEWRGKQQGATQAEAGTSAEKAGKVEGATTTRHAGQQAGQTGRAAGKPAAGPARAPARAVEVAEAKATRAVETADEYVKAVEETRKQFNDLVSKVPDEVKESAWWKEKVKPHLDKVDSWTNVETARKALDEMSKLLKMRQDWYRDVRHVDREKLEGGIWLERGLDQFGKALSSAYQRLVTDPAKKAAGQLPGDMADTAKKALDGQQQAIEQTFDGIRKLPRTAAQRFRGGEQMMDQLDQIQNTDPRFYQQLRRDTDIKLRPQDRPDFGKGLRKLKPAYDKAVGYYEQFRGWLDRNGPVAFRRIPRPDI